MDDKMSLKTPLSASRTIEARFDLQDEEAWLGHLQSEGFVVLKSILSKEQSKKAIDLFWTHIESALGIDRKNVETWAAWDLDERGLMTGATAQCEGAWFVRGISRIKNAFTKIWATQDLLVSMDAVFAWRPWWYNQDWTPCTEGLHVDQNPFDKPEFCCVQGMVPLYNVTEEVGGLEVVRRTHTDDAKEALRAKYPEMAYNGDFCALDPSDPMNERSQLILAQSGDLILWDSRTVHGGRVGTKRQMCADGDTSTSKNTLELARLSVPVCMTPRSWAKGNVSRERREAFEQGDCLSHWPHEEAGAGAHATGGTTNYRPIKLTPEQESLL